MKVGILRKFLLLMIIVAMMTTVFVGCSKKDNEQVSTGDTSASNVTPSKTEEPSSTPESTEPEPVSFTLSMHVANVEEKEPATYDIVQAFMQKYPYITVNIDGKETEEHTKAMKVAAQANNLPEVFWILPADAKEMSKAGYLLDLTGFLNENLDMKTNFLPNTLESYNVDGVQVGLPYQPLVTGFWYNKKILADNGLEVPKTYDDLLNVVKVLSAKGIVPIAKGSKDAFSTWAFQQMFVRYGYFDKIDKILAGEEKFNNQDFLNMFNKVDELRTAGAFPENITAMGYFDALQMFERGEAAMLDAGAWLTSEFEQLDIADQIGFWWGPTFSDSAYPQEVGMKVGAAPFVVAKTVEKDPAKLDAVKKFLAFYYGEEGTKIMVEQNQILPPVYYHGDFDASNYPVYSTVLSALNDSWSSPLTQPDLYVPTAVADEMNNSLYGVINGTYTPEEALNRIDEAVSQNIQ